jgi:hypothetical protein
VQLRNLALLFLWNLPPFWYSDSPACIGCTVDWEVIAGFWFSPCASLLLLALFFAAHGADKEGHTWYFLNDPSLKKYSSGAVAGTTRARIFIVGINTLSHTGILPSGMPIPMSSANLITLLRLLSVSPLPQLKVSILNFWNISIPVLSSFHVVAAWTFFDAGLPAARSSGLCHDFICWSLASTSSKIYSSCGSSGPLPLLSSPSLENIPAALLVC